MSWLDEFKSGFTQAAEEGPEDWRQAFFEGRARTPAPGSTADNPAYLDQTDAPKLETIWNTNPTVQRIGENLGLFDKQQKEARDRKGLGLQSTGAGRAGQMLGTLANDIANDKSRSFWWLMNAPQAVVDVTAETLLSAVNPDLFSSETVMGSDGSPLRSVSNKRIQEFDPETGIPQFKTNEEQADYNKARNYKDAERGIDGLIDEEAITRRKGIGMDSDGYYTRRKYAPGAVAALGVPTGIGINAGLGLLNPLGGSGGYEAALPSAEDPTKTSNVIAEIGAKYLLGRTGNLLPYDEFRKVRPDVSKGEYNAYKAFKYDKALDLDLSDGDFTLPMGVLKGTTDGIHGPELQFLGRSMPVTTTIVPTLGAMAGVAYGVSRSRGAAPGKRTAIRDGLLYGMGGLGVSTAAGLLAEEARRRASSVSNQQLNQPEQ